MSEHEPEHTAEAVSILCQRVRELTAETDRFTAKKQRKQKITAVAGTLLAVTAAFSLSGLTSMTKQLDAEAIAQISRQHIEARLPDARMKAQAYLVQEAPRIVGSTIRSMLDNLPQVRSFVFKGLMTKLDELNFEFERNTIEIMSQFVHESKREIDATYPDLPDRQKVEKLVEAVATRFKTTIKESTLAMYPQYQSEMNRAISHLDTLENTDPAKLTPEQKIHKEIIETLLQLLERRQDSERIGR